MRAKLLSVVGSAVALAVVLSAFFLVRPEVLLRRGEEPLGLGQVAAGQPFAGKPAGEDIPRVAGAEEFMAKYDFQPFTLEPLDAIPTGVYELARWRSATQVVGRRTRNYARVTTSSIWAMTGYNQYYLLQFPDGTYALGLLDQGLARRISRGEAVTLPVCTRAGVETAARPYLADLCARYGADPQNVVYAFDDEWYREHTLSLVLLRLAAAGGAVLVCGLVYGVGGELLKGKKKT